MKPVAGYAAKGILWYQGCSNMGQPHCYDKLQAAMVRMWRKVWGNLGSISERKIVGFELAGEDRIFHLSDAEVDWDGQTLIVKCADVPHPVAVRYGFRNWMGANLCTSYGIPVPPFRSDDWEY